MQGATSVGAKYIISPTKNWPQLRGALKLVQNHMTCKNRHLKLKDGKIDRELDREREEERDRYERERVCVCVCVCVSLCV